MSTLLLKLAGPMQSWGTSSLFDRRDTGDYPTKSGVIGILAGALGRKRGESLDDLRELRFGVRVDAPGERLDDFQITKMKGEKKSYNANLSHRFYLQDAAFLVGLECDDEARLKEYEEALRRPVYAPFLGRKSCPPSGPIVIGVKEEGLETALRESDWTLSGWRKNGILRKTKTVYLRILLEDKTSTTTVRDNPVSFSPLKRSYTYRGIRECKPKTVSAMDIHETTHDAMAELG